MNTLTFTCIVLCRPEIFKSTIVEDTKESMQTNTFQQVNETHSSDDDGLPPLEANTNRMRPFELQVDSDSESGSETDA